MSCKGKGRKKLLRGKNGISCILKESEGSFLVHFKPKGSFRDMMDDVDENINGKRLVRKGGNMTD